MKRINIFSWLLLIGMGLFVGACEEEELTGPVLDLAALGDAANPSFAISNPSSEPFVFYQDSADNIFQAVTITPGNTGDISLPWEYSLEADITGSGAFAEPLNLRTTSGLTMEITVGEMNSALFNAGVPVETPTDINLRVKAVAKSASGNSDLALYSAPVTMNITLYEDIVVIVSDIGIIGSATPLGWDEDTDMANPSGDNVNYELNIYLVEGEAKFRKDNDWATNWGAGDFPTGTGEADGPNIPIPAAANYLVKFNAETGEYSFEAVTRIGIIGSATPGGWDADTDMLNPSGDDENWELVIELAEGEAKFRADNAWDLNWGGTDFPSGTATEGGDNIPIATAGVYTVKFNSTTGEYSFTEGDGGPTTYETVGIIGDATGSWDEDTDMSNPSGDGINWEITIDLVDGEAKFRADNDWAVSWGATDFPSGTATMGGDNIPVTAGTYKVKFNTKTGEYSFDEPGYATVGIIGSATPGGWDADTDMMNPSGDGLMWEVMIELTDGEAKFRADDDWAVNWGATDFPSGTATEGGDNIPVTAGFYKVTFNAGTGEYTFEEVRYATIGIIGSATAGGWDEDTDMENPSGDGINWELTIELSDGEAKFRADNDWAVNWGAADFPSGTATMGGDNIPVGEAGTYKVTFNAFTGVYTFEKQ